MKILFVCSSNVCRSPFAEFYFRRLVAQNNPLNKDIEWIKSGAVLNRSKILHPKAKQALIAEGFSAEELDKHIPRFIFDDRATFEQADIIIGMSRFHGWLLPKALRKKFHTLSELTMNKYIKIPDPFLIKSQLAYNNAMQPIKTYLNIYYDSLRS